MSKLGVFYVNTVSADYFRVMGTRILRGRPIESTDIGGGRRVAVVSESMAGVLWRGLGSDWPVLQDRGRHDAVHLRGWCG